MTIRLTLLLWLCCLVGIAAAQPQINSTLALMQAITTGGHHEVGPGNYFIDRTLDVADDLVLVGAGAGVTVLMVTNGELGLRIAGGDVRLQDLTIGHVASAPGDIVHVAGGSLHLQGVLLNGAKYGVDDSGTKAYGWGAGIYAWGDAQLTVQDSQIWNNELVGFELRDQASLRILGGSVSDNGVGLHAEQRVQVEVSGATFEGNTFGAIQVADDVVAQLRGNVFAANGVADETTGQQSDGIRFGGASQGLLEGNRILDHPRFALSLWGQAQVETLGNHFEGNGGEYELLETYASAVLLEDESSLSMAGDVFLRNPGGALELDDDGSAELHQVLFEANGSWAAIYLGRAAELRLVDTRVVDHDGSVFVGGSARLRMERSEISGSRDDGLILADEAEAYLEASIVRGNAALGIVLLHASQIVLVDNLIEGNRSGVVLWNQTRAELRGNRILDSERTGLAFFDGSTGTARGNEVHGSGWNGVLVEDDASATLEGNDLRGNLRVGIGYAQRGGGTASGNTIAGSERGIRIGAAAQPALLDNVFEGNGEDVVRLP